MKVPCPACKKQISASATKCPYCLTEFTDEQVAQLKSMRKGAAIGCGALAAIFFLFVFACSGDADKTDSASSEQAEESSEQSRTVLNTEQEGVLDFVRAVSSQAVNCGAHVELVKMKVDQVQRGSADATSVFQAMERAEENCEDSIGELNGFTKGYYEKQASSPVAQSGIEQCRLSAENFVKSMQLGRKVLEDSQLEDSARFREAMAEGTYHETECELIMSDIAKAAGIPDSVFRILR